MTRAKPADTLPEPAARDTKRKRATMTAFNDRIDAIIRERGGELVYYSDGDVNEILGYHVRRWRIETPAGILEINPAGHSVMCRFLEPVRGEMTREQVAIATFPGSPPLNTYSGKWNHHYFGQPLAASAAHFASNLDVLLARRGMRVASEGTRSPARSAS